MEVSRPSTPRAGRSAACTLTDATPSQCLAVAESWEGLRGQNRRTAGEICEPAGSRAAALLGSRRRQTRRLQRQRQRLRPSPRRAPESRAGQPPRLGSPGAPPPPPVPLHAARRGCLPPPRVPPPEGARSRRASPPMELVPRASELGSMMGEVWRDGGRQVTGRHEDAAEALLGDQPPQQRARRHRCEADGAVQRDVGQSRVHGGVFFPHTTLGLE
mmetsp:Transcript_19772/g.65408  ORF Transcript_19772/g.65408 Transcript_19772/m.65408 type:complete len:216 (+) Transcript_19772:810-1457(+)